MRGAISHPAGICFKSPGDYPEVRQRSFAALRMTARGVCHPERSEGSVVRMRPADPTHVALGLLGNHQLKALLTMPLFPFIVFNMVLLKRLVKTNRYS